MEVEKAFKRLLIKNPFYGLFCLSLPKVVTRNIPTMCISRNGVNCQLNINPDFWERHTDDEQIALLQHELSHICLQHMFISDSFENQHLFNIAADCEVNSYIDNLPKDAMTAKGLSTKMQLTVPLEDGLGSKKYYDEIQKYLQQQQQQAQAQNPQQPCNGGQGGHGSQSSSQSQSSQGNQEQSGSQKEDKSQNQDSQQSQSPQKDEQQPPSPQEEEQKPDNQEQPDDTEDDSQPDENEQRQQERGQDDEEPEMPEQYPEEFSDFKPIDDHSKWKDFQNIPEANRQLMQNNINSILKQTAEEVQKMRGTIPGELSEIIEKLKQKMPEVFNWKAYFRRLLGSIYDVNIRSTRRKQSKRFEDAAGIQHKKKVSILVAVDTSGSVSEKELKEFFSEIDYVYKAGARVTIIQCDTRINGVEDYDGTNIPKIKGRGGTDFNPPVNYYVMHKKEYASLIYFTDGEAPIPTKNPSGMVWVISSMGYHQDYPGKTIYIPKETEQQ